MGYRLHLGDCLAILPTLEAQSIDSIVCDPPYGLSFMGKDWDHGVPGVPFWEAALRVAKPGAHLLAFGGPRTHHRLMCAVEDAGWEIRDCLMWLYGSGFPKSMDISKAIDKAAGAEREVIGQKKNLSHVERGDSNIESQSKLMVNGYSQTVDKVCQITAPATDTARQWDGWGTALKPAWEPIIMARKPLDGTVAANVLAHGCGALNVAGCRIEMANGDKKSEGGRITAKPYGENIYEFGSKNRNPQHYGVGRWPANLMLDEEAARLLDEQSGTLTSGKPNGAKRNVSGPFLAHANGVELMGYGDTGGASRFFYVAKASKRDRDEDNHHPTVKPTQLMRYLCRMVTPPNGTVLDPFCGSGSTGKAAVMEGFSFIGIDTEAEYLAIAQRRIEDAAAQPMLLEVQP